MLLVLALAGPGRITKERVYLTRGIDIIFVLDESPSMAAQDFYPENRFNTAREVINSFIRSRENDPVGLVVFSDEAALMVPPTLDYSAYLRVLDDLQLMSLGRGTAIGMGIAVASLHLRQSSAQEKIIVLLTDGEKQCRRNNPRQRSGGSVFSGNKDLRHRNREPRGTYRESIRIPRREKYFAGSSPAATMRSFCG